MILDALATAASENLLHTYFELGRASARSKIWRENGFQACVGDIVHPICNFAAGLDLDYGSANRLARIALDREIFNVYATPMDRPDNLGELLAHEGFHRSFRLVQMIAQPGGQKPKNILSRATTRYDRLRIALFMVDQFFAKQNQRFRLQVADATARATTLELLAMKREGKIRGGAMVCLRHGMAGVYNVCVDESLRGLGIGTSIVREILAVCSVKNVPATLQCDNKLQAWYNAEGFLPVGEIDVFALSKPKGIVIMQ